MAAQYPTKKAISPDLALKANDTKAEYHCKAFTITPERLDMRWIVLLALTIATTASRADDWVLGGSDPNEAITLTTDQFVDGNLVITNSAALTVADGVTLTVAGDIVLTNAASLTMGASTLVFPQNFAYQSDLGVYDQAQLSLTNTTIDGGGYSFSLGLLGTADAMWTNTAVVNGFATWALLDAATANLDGCTNTGEFLCFGTNTLNIDNSDTVLLWLTLPDGSVIDTTLPAPGAVSSFALTPNSAFASGIPYAATITDCTGVMFGVLARSGSDATFRDSTLRTMGTYFGRANTVTVTGVANNQTLTDASFAWGDHALHLVNTAVETWSFYANGTTDLTIESSVFGELIVDENATATMTGSLCDGSGGYVGVFHDGFLIMASSTNLAQTTVGDQALMIASSSALLSPTIDATEDAVLVLLNTPAAGDPAASDAAVIFDGTIDPVEATVGQAVTIRGSARMTAGPTSPWTFDGFTLDFGPGSEPSAWTSIADLNPEPVRDGPLGTWATAGLNPGAYTVRLSLVHPFGEPITVTAPATLASNPCPADLTSDGALDFFDVAAFIQAFAENDPAADFNADGVFDFFDISSFLTAYSAGCP